MVVMPPTPTSVIRICKAGLNRSTFESAHALRRRARDTARSRAQFPNVRNSCGKLFTIYLTAIVSFYIQNPRTITVIHDTAVYARLR